LNATSVRDCCRCRVVMSEAVSLKEVADKR
jgi:hypothetical protein